GNGGAGPLGNGLAGLALAAGNGGNGALSAKPLFITTSGPGVINITSTSVVGGNGGASGATAGSVPSTNPIVAISGGIGGAGGNGGLGGTLTVTTTGTNANVTLASV